MAEKELLAQYIDTGTLIVPHGRTAKWRPRSVDSRTCQGRLNELPLRMMVTKLDSCDYQPRVPVSLVVHLQSP